MTVFNRTCRALTDRSLQYHIFHGYDVGRRTVRNASGECHRRSGRGEDELYCQCHCAYRLCSKVVNSRGRVFITYIEMAETPGHVRPNGSFKNLAWGVMEESRQKKKKNKKKSSYMSFYIKNRTYGRKSSPAPSGRYTVILTPKNGRR